MYEVDTRELKIAMAEAGMDTIEKFSKASGVNRNTLSGVVNGQIYPSSIVMSKIANTLKMTGERAGRIFFKRKLA